MKNVEIILVPGLGDSKPLSAWFYERIAKKWRKQGYVVQVYRASWRTQDGASSKLDALVKVIDAVHDRGNKVILFGISAGASLALLGYVARPKVVTKVVTICGWINADHPGFTHLTNPNMTCREVLLRWGVERDQLSKEQLQNILAIRPLFDEIVYARMAHMKGIKNKRVLFAGHVPSIAWILLTKTGLLRRFIEK